MEELLADNESSFMLLFTILGSFGALLGSFGSLLMLQSSQLRKLLLFLLIGVAVAELLLVGWGVKVRLSKPTKSERTRIPSPKSTPRPSPSQPVVESTKTEEEAIAEGVTFDISSRTNSSIRQMYCIESNVGGTFYTHGGRLRVRLTTAEFDLCNYSSDAEREVEVRVGVGTRSDIASKNWKAISWSPPQRGTVAVGSVAQLIPESPLTLTLKRSRKVPADLSGYGAVISVYNKDRRGLYYISD